MTEATGTEIGAPPQLDDRLPIIVGITGHRDPRDVAKLREDLASALQRIDEITPRSPIWLLSPLAAGADQEFAEVGLDEVASSRMLLGPESVRLIVPLPFELDDYRVDFESDPEGRARFDRLLARADRSFVLPPRRASDLFEHRRPDGTVIQRVGGSDDSADDIRSLHYDRLGRFMATHAHVMIAAWNGRPSRGRGGTASIVAYCENGDGTSYGDGVPLRANLSPIERRRPTPLLKIHCPRMSDSVDATVTADEHLFPVTDELQQETRDDLIRIDQINGLSSPGERRFLFDSSAHHDRGPLGRLAFMLIRRRVARGRIPDAISRRFSANADKDGQSLALQFVRLDAWALLDKASYQRASAMSAGILGAALVFLQLYGLGAGAATNLAVFGYLIGLGLYIRWKSILRRREIDRSTVRPAAELLRIQLGWILAGVDRLIIDEIVPRRRQTLSSVEEILKGPMLVTLGRRMSAAHALGINAAPELGIAAAVEGWVEDQLTYCTGNSLRMKRKRSDTMHRARRRLRSVVLGVAIVSSIVAAMSLIPWTRDTMPANFDRFTLPIADFLMGTSLVAVLVIQFLEAVTLERQDVQQAAGMRGLLTNAACELNKLGDIPPHAATRILLDLGRSLADEQIEWYSRHKEGADLDIVG